MSKATPEHLAYAKMVLRYFFGVKGRQLAESELMALASCCCEIVWAHHLAIKLGFSQLKPTDFTKIILAASLWQTICTVDAASTLLCVFALFRNSFKMESYKSQRTIVNFYEDSNPVHRRVTHSL